MTKPDALDSLDRRSGIPEQIKQLGLLGSAGLGIDMLQMRACCDFADAEHGSGVFNAETGGPATR
jgi:hypothetical protein